MAIVKTHIDNVVPDRADSNEGDIWYDYAAKETYQFHNGVWLPVALISDPYPEDPEDTAIYLKSPEPNDTYGDF